MPRREMYKKGRLAAFLGLHVSVEMNSEIEAEAERALHRKGAFVRILLEEGLKSWRLSHLRAGKGELRNEFGLAASRPAAKRGE
jgi:hypothetical protein